MFTFFAIIPSKVHHNRFSHTLSVDFASDGSASIAPFLDISGCHVLRLGIRIFHVHPAVGPIATLGSVEQIAGGGHDL